jgi:hypothetical protein
MSQTGNKVFSLYINSANRSSTEKPYDFTVFFDNEEIVINPNDGVNVNVASFSLLNSMYNVNKHTGNNIFHVYVNGIKVRTVVLPFGNYDVYTFMEQLNISLADLITVSYNTATNTYTYTSLVEDACEIHPLECNKLLGLKEATAISTAGTISGYVNMVNYQQIILRCPSLVFESCSLDNIQDKKNFFSISDFLYWVNKQDVEPFKMVNYKNDDCGTVYSYNVANRKFNTLNFKLVNEFNEFIYDAPDFLLQLQITVFDKDNTYFKEASLQVLKLLNEIYFILLNFISLFGFFKRRRLN